MYKFWMYYLGTPNNVGQDPPLKRDIFVNQYYGKYSLLFSNTYIQILIGIMK